MSLAFVGPARVILYAMMRDTSDRAKFEVGKLAALAVALGLIASSALVVLARAVGYPVAALAFAGLFLLLAWGFHILGRSRAARQRQRIAQAQSSAAADLAVAIAAARSALPLLPLIAFVTAFTFARRR